MPFHETFEWHNVLALVMLKGLCPLLLGEPHKVWPMYSGCLLSLPLMKMVERVGDYHLSGFILLNVQLSYSWVISHLSGCVMELLRLFGWLWTLLLPATWSFLDFFLIVKLLSPFFPFWASQVLVSSFLLDFKFSFSFSFVCSITIAICFPRHLGFLVIWPPACLLLVHVVLYS